MSIQDMHERLKKANERRNCGADEELSRLRAENGALVEALKSFRQKIRRLVEAVDSELFHAEQFWKAEQSGKAGKAEGRQ